MTSFTDPVLAGTILNTAGNTVGQNVANMGTAILVQASAVTQASGATTIVVPQGSTILSIELFVGVIWSGVAATLEIGNTVSTTAYTAAAAVTGGTLGLVSVTPGTSLTQINNWLNVGTTDVKLVVTSTNTGTGTGTLVVTYLMTASGT